jgi:hypothetical protein
VKAVIFLGPTLPLEAARLELDAVYLPPVAQGDVYRAASRKPPAIGIVDGYFSQVPAVWHKEILWAMSQGIHVFGSASMGALRAAELHAFGMEGVGAVYEAYARGELEDDDEVAITHGPEELGYPSLSEAMVNIRATLAQAEALGAVPRATAERLLQAAKSMWFPERNYEDIVARESADPTARRALAAWLRDNRVDQKREDAVAMLRHIRARLEAGLPPKCVNFHLERSSVFERMTSEIEQADSGAPRDPELPSNQEG